MSTERLPHNYVATTLRSEPVLLERLVAAGRRRDSTEIDQITDQLAGLGLVRQRSDQGRFTSRSAEARHAR